MIHDIFLSSHSKRNEGACRIAKSIGFYCLVAFFAIATTIASFADDTKPSLALINIRPDNIEESKALSVFGSIANSIYKLDAYTIIERSELAKYIPMKDLFASGAVENRAAVKAGKSAGAQFVLITTLSIDKGSYFLSMKLIDVQTEKTFRLVKSTNDFNKVVDLSDGLLSDLLVRKQGSATDETKPVAHDSAAKKGAFGNKDFYLAAGLDCAVPIPVLDTAKLLNITVAPSLFFEALFVFDWGVVSAGLGGGFDYFGVKNQASSYVMDIPVTIKADYIFPLSDTNFYLFGGFKAGIVVTNYKTQVDTSPVTGLISYVSPELGAGYSITGMVTVGLGASFDMAIFSDLSMHTNVSPFIRAMLLL
jgi:hypothetical protein